MKVVAYTRQVERLTAEEHDILARSDLIVGYVRPEHLAMLRQKAVAAGRQLRFIQEHMPICVYPPGDIYEPDLEWSIIRRMDKASQENDWYLYDVNGRPITIFSGQYRLLNWTQYCPVGTHGDATGLRASQYFAEALYDLAVRSNYWKPWSWYDLSTVNGYCFEIIADCLGGYGINDQLRLADPNRDGHPEGISSVCSQGGITQPLSNLMRRENALLYAKLKSLFPADFIWLINDNRSFIGPTWRHRLPVGIKLENFGGWGLSWHDWMFGDPGYLSADALMGERGGFSDAMVGTEMSQVWAAYDPAASTAENERRMRFALGSALLGNGYFGWRLDEHHPLWHPLMGQTLGRPMGPYREEQHGDLTVYTRRYARGNVVVNPNQLAVDNLPARDARIETA